MSKNIKESRYKIRKKDSIIKCVLDEFAEEIQERISGTRIDLDDDLYNDMSKYNIEDINYLKYLANKISDIKPLTKYKEYSLLVESLKQMGNLDNQFGIIPEFGNYEYFVPCLLKSVVPEKRIDFLEKSFREDDYSDNFELALVSKYRIELSYSKDIDYDDHNCEVWLTILKNFNPKKEDFIKAASSNYLYILDRILDDFEPEDDTFGHIKKLLDYNNLTISEYNKINSDIINKIGSGLGMTRDELTKYIADSREIDE